jgi:ABC-2 type transport system ATP-binding protein
MSASTSGQTSCSPCSGPNGAGKTTLLHILCTILRPDSGTARVNDVDTAKSPLQARRRLGVVFQEPSLDDRLTVYENLNFHGLVYGVPAAQRKSRIDEMLALVELADWRERLVRTLSSGMKRRLEIARALVHDTRTLFLDEPTVGLDAQSRERIWQYLHRLRSERELTVIVTTHYIEEVEGCDRVCNDGEIVLKSSGDAFTESFLARFGSRIRRFVVQEPSLESVFLSLTGRELRDQAAGARERTYEFGKRGGEHTR